MSSWCRYVPERIVPCFILVMLFLAGTGIVSAHAPLGVGPEEGIANATLIANPEKSFVLYNDLPGNGDAHYYLFPMQEGQVLYGSLQIPGPDSNVPDIVIIGPGLEPSGEIPPSVYVPPGSGAMLVTGTIPGKPSYEPFSPQPIYEVAKFNVTVPRQGNYYLAIFRPEGGKYSLAPGFLEQFTVTEWLLIPWSVLAIHIWEGQSLPGIFAPMGIVLAGGLAFFSIRKKKTGTRLDPIGLLILVSGLLYIGGAAMTGWQIVHAVQVTGFTSGVFITLMFIAGPLILGILAILAGTRSPGMNYSYVSGIWMLLIGLLGLMVWAGLIIGPVLALASGVFIIVKHTIRSGSA